MLSIAPASSCGKSSSQACLWGPLKLFCWTSQAEAHLDDLSGPSMRSQGSLSRGKEGPWGRGGNDSGGKDWSETGRG